MLLQQALGDSGKEKLNFKLLRKKPPAEPGSVICPDWMGVRGE